LWIVGQVRLESAGRWDWTVGTGEFGGEKRWNEELCVGDGSWGDVEETGGGRRGSLLILFSRPQGGKRG
jgi:hypothetical protein